MRDELERHGQALPPSSRASRPTTGSQMRLSAYVLAYRLSQVVAAANERLGRMSDQRYSLEHTGQRGAGETRGGLSLLVRDDWSGETRDPATLSGGETFVVSLALALGLADVDHPRGRRRRPRHAVRRRGLRLARRRHPRRRDGHPRRPARRRPGRRRGQPRRRDARPASRPSCASTKAAPARPGRASAPAETQGWVDQAARGRGPSRRSSRRTCGR